MLLAELDVVVIDCQASGASPRYGALLEMGWAVTGPGGYLAPLEARWIVPPPGTLVSRHVRRLTGWSEDCLSNAVRPEEAWLRVRQDVARAPRLPAPCVAHFARFELSFLADLHQRHGDGPFPLDTV